MMWRYILATLLLLQACSAPTQEEPSFPTLDEASVEAASESSNEVSSSDADEKEPISAVSETLPAGLPPLLTPKQGNLIANPGAEIAVNPATPEGWSSDHWGNNSANLSWEGNTPFSGEKYLSVTMAERQDGDAKWLFEPLSLQGDTWYEYSDYYRSDGRSRMIWSCTKPDGTRRFHTVWQSHQSSEWKANRFRFYVSPSQADCSQTLMHVLDRNGYLHTDHHQLKTVQAAPLKTPIVSITFDDIYTSAVDIGARELEKRGWKGSFYVTGRYARLADAPEYANVDKIKDIIAKGHEVGSHSNTHPVLSSLNANDLIFEIQSNVDYLKFLGQNPDGIAYPFGDFSQAVETETKRFHQYARTSLTGLNDAHFDPYRLRILPVTNTTTTLELLNWIDDAERTSTWLILLFHDLADQEDAATYTTGAIQYLQVLNYLKDREHIQVLSVKEALDQLAS